MTFPPRQRRYPLRIALLALGTLCLSTLGCNLFPGVPATPTLIPTRSTATPTPTPTMATPVALLPTTTPSVTATATPTTTLTLTSTGTVTILPTVTATFTATATPTSTATATATPPPTLTFTLSAAPPTSAPTAAPVSPTLTVAASSTRPTVAAVTFTPLPAALLSTSTPRPSIPPIPTRQVIVITSTPPLLPGTPVAVAPFTATVPVAAAIPTISLQVGDTTVTIGGETLKVPFRDASGQLPADFDISSSGRRVFVGFDGRLTIDGAPYVGDDKHIRQRFLSARWSPDGRWLAYIVQTDGADSGTLSWAQTIDDGVWVLDTATAGAKPTLIYRNSYYRDSNEFPYRVAFSLAWANDNYALLIGVRTVAGVSTILAGREGELQPFESIAGAWLADSSGWAATRTNEVGAVMLGTLNRNGTFVTALDGSLVNLWIQNPARLDGGAFVFLGKPSDGGRFNGSSGLRLYRMTTAGIPTPISAPLEGEVLSAEWSPSRRALLVQLNTLTGLALRVITVDGQIIDVTAAGGGIGAAHW